MNEHQNSNCLCLVRLAVSDINVRRTCDSGNVTAAPDTRHYHAVFHDGAVAWNGLLAFWLPASAFGGWFPVMFVFLRKAIKQQAAEQK